MKVQHHCEPSKHKGVDRFTVLELEWDEYSYFNSKKQIESQCFAQ